MRILFMGTPDFAVASLKRLVEDGHDICGVFTQPDKPKNRGHKLAFSPVKEYALSQDLAVYQPLKMRDAEAMSIRPCCPSTGGRRPSTGPFWTARRRPASPSCIWQRSWTPAT